MIDELERVRTFRADVAEPTDGVERAARAALESAIRERSARPRRRPRRRVWLVPATSTVAVAIALLIFAGVLGTGSSGPPTASAAIFTRLAAVARAQPSSAPGPGQYLYVESVQTNESDAPEVGCTMLVPEHRQIWIGADGSGRLFENTGRASFPSAADRAACARANLLGSAAPNRSDTWFAARCLSLGPVDLQNLPADPAALRQLLDARKIEGGPPGPAEDFTQIGDLLRETDASPALRAAIYKVAATIPGVEVLGLARDHSGRLGIGLAYGHPGGRSELIFDPRTSALLGELDTDTAGRLVGWAVYLRSTIVDSIPGRPPAPLRPACSGGGGYNRTTPSGASVTTGARVR